jgi:hypothetical protein
MLENITYFQILGKPLIMYIGIITLVLFISVALIPILNKRGKKIPFKWHHRLAAVAIILALIHGLLGAAVYF